VPFDERVEEGLGRTTMQYFLAENENFDRVATV